VPEPVVLNHEVREAYETHEVRKKEALRATTNQMADAPGSGELAARDALYEQAAGEFGGALHRLARAYEANPDRRQDLLQDIHIALWRSFATFDRRCSLRTWVFRVAHNVATSQVIRRRVHITGMSSGNVATKVGMSRPQA
jgi:DNA-directed RNA polymerase specialized sigma24 family protein